MNRKEFSQDIKGINKYNIGDKVRTKIYYQNDSRTEVDAIIRGVELDDESDIVRYKIRFNAIDYDKKQGCTGCIGYVCQDWIIDLVN